MFNSSTIKHPCTHVDNISDHCRVVMLTIFYEGGLFDILIDHKALIFSVLFLKSRLNPFLEQTGT